MIEPYILIIDGKEVHAVCNLSSNMLWTKKD